MKINNCVECRKELEAEVQKEQIKMLAEVLVALRVYNVEVKAIRLDSPTARYAFKQIKEGLEILKGLGDLA